MAVIFPIIGILFLVFVIVALSLAIRSPSVPSLFLATLSMFSLGHFALPLLLPTMADLGSIPVAEINSVALMCGLYIASVLLGFWLIARRSGAMPALRFERLDRLAESHWWLTSIAAAAGYIFYLQNTDLTSYATQDFSGFFEDRSPFAAIIGFFSSFALAILSLNMALAVMSRRGARIAFSLVVFGFIELRLLSGAQRLLFITPIIMIFVSLAGMRQYRVAGTALVTGVLALLVVSPFAVALRQARGGGNSDVKTATVSYDQGYFQTTLQSIVDRSDLIYNMTFLKPYVDQHGYVGSTFYESVLVIPIPRAIMPDKPYELSDTGKPDGEVSILAWHIIVGDTIGSLTAFGPIVAYREGGWIAVIVDGIAAGALFAFCLGVTARSGYFGRVFLPMAFLAFAVAKPGPSFFEGLAQVLTYVPILLGLGFVEALLALVIPRRRSSAPSGPSVVQTQPS